MKSVVMEIQAYNNFSPYVGALLKASVLRSPLLDGRVEMRLETAFAQDDADELTRRVLAHGPQVVGFTCFLWNIRKVLDVSRRLKQADPGIRVILGGPEVSPIPRKVLLANPSVDVIVSGEGEVSYVELLAHYLGVGGPLGGIGGITFRDGERLLQTLPRPFADVDRLASPYLSGLPEMDRFYQWTLLETSRGCPFDCKFCDDHTNQRVRWFPMERVAREIEYLATRAANVQLTDSDIFLNRVRARELIRLFSSVARRHPITFWFSHNPIFLDEESMALLNSSCFNVGIGVQSIDDDVLELITRPHNHEKLDRKMDRLKELSPRVRYNIFVIYGLPGDDLEKFQDSLDWELSKRPDWPGGAHTLVLPGAGLGRHPEKYGLTFEQTPPYRILSSPTWSYTDLVEATRIMTYVRAFCADPYVQETLYGLGKILAGREPRPFLSAFRGFYEFLCDAGAEDFLRLKRAQTLDDPSSPNRDGNWNVMVPMRWPSFFEEDVSDDFLLLVKKYVEQRAGGLPETEGLSLLLRAGMRRNEITRHTGNQREALDVMMMALPGLFMTGNRALILGSGVTRLMDHVRTRAPGLDVTLVELERCSYIDSPEVFRRRIFLWHPEEMLEADWEGRFDVIIAGLLNPNGRPMPLDRIGEWVGDRLGPEGRLVVLDGEDPIFREAGFAAFFRHWGPRNGWKLSKELAVGGEDRKGWKVRAAAFERTLVAAAASGISASDMPVHPI